MNVKPFSLNMLTIKKIIQYKTSIYIKSDSDWMIDSGSQDQVTV